MVASKHIERVNNHDPKPASIKEKKARGGRDNKLKIEEMLLMNIEYLRENRTYIHISQSYERTAYKTIKRAEDTLIKQPLSTAWT